MSPRGAAVVIRLVRRYSGIGGVPKEYLSVVGTGSTAGELGTPSTGVGDPWDHLRAVEHRVHLRQTNKAQTHKHTGASFAAP